MGVLRDFLKNLNGGSRIKDEIQNFLILAGIRLRRPLTGPWHAQIDLTNACNNNCIGCWCHSPLLGELMMDDRTKSRHLPFDTAVRLIDDLAAMGTREIYFTGGGEPFMHPQATELIEHAKRRGLCCDMSSNITLIDEAKVERLVRAGLDNINCSLWAGDGETYARTHPNQNAATFERIRRTFDLFAQAKQRLGREKPTLRIYNVISSINCASFRQMLEFAYEVRADGIDFTPTDIVPGKTDVLMLSPAQRQTLRKEVEEAPTLMRELESRCGHRLHFLNYEQFLRRLASDETEHGVYDKDIIGRMPCYAGWTFVRVLADGNVNPCLKAVRMPVGNIFEESLRETWHGARQREFRRHTIDYRVNDPYFSSIGNSHQKNENGCLLCCDNLGLNLMFHGRLGRPGPAAAPKQ